MKNSVILGAIACAMLAGTAMADPVLFTSALPSGATSTSGPFGAKYRLNPSNFDQSIDSGNGTGAGAFGNFHVTRNLGNIASLNNVVWNFSLSQNQTNGLTFTLSNGATTHTVHWGINAPVGSTATATLANATTGGLAWNHRAYNSLQLFAQTSFSSGNADPDGNITWNNMSFSSPTLGNGAFNNGALFSPPTSNNNQWLYFGTDMRSHDWTLTGTVSGYRLPANQGGGDEAVRFVIMGQQVNGVVLVPTPLAALSGLAGIGLVGIRRRRGF